MNLFIEIDSGIKEFLEIKPKERKNSEVILYLELKLEITRHSSLFRRIVKMHAGLASQLEVDSYV